MNGPFAEAQGFTSLSALGSGNGPARGGVVNGSRGRTNGLAKGIGRTNGLANGVGRTNGLVNGIGRTNGLVNGVRPPDGRSARTRFRSVTRRDIRAAYAIFGTSVAIMLILSFLLGTPAPTRPAFVFAVDGNFAEWQHVPINVDPPNSGPGQGDLLAYAVHAEASQLFVYGKTRSPLFEGAAVSSVYVLIHDPNKTGYLAPELDAEYVAEIWGWNSTLQGTLLRGWNGAADRDNASELQPTGGFAAASVGNQFEMALDRNEIGWDPSIQVAVAARAADVLDEGAVVGLTPGALAIDEFPLTNVVSGATPVLQVKFRALATDIRVDRVSFGLVGGGSVQPLPLPFWITAGQEVTRTVVLDPGSAPAGQFIRLRVGAVTAVSTMNGTVAPTTILGPEARVYVQALPTGKTIDGVFNDWTNTTPDPVDPVPPSLDILASAMSVPGSGYFYMETRGPILAGSILPERRLPSPPIAGAPPSPPIPLPRRAGMDVMVAYISTDDRNATGPSVGGISANRKMEVTGRLGTIRSAALFAWNSTTSTWDRLPETPNVASAGTQIEASVSASFLGPVFNPRTVFAMSDWSRTWDLTDVPIRSNAPALMGAPSPLHAVTPDEISATLLANTPAIDGRCASSPGEYLGASIGVNANLQFFVGRRDDTQFVYVCIQVTSDITSSKSDWGELVFDTLHNGGTAPQTDDRLFYVFGNGDNVLKSWQGNGASWDPICPACDPGNVGASRFSTNEFYEFKIRYTDVWGTLTPINNQTAGFAIIAFNNPGVLYTWGGPAVNENVPDTWGHLFYPIPEFPMPALAAVAVVIPIVRGLRRRPAARVADSRGQDAPRLDVFPSATHADRAEVAKLGPTRQT